MITCVTGPAVAYKQTKARKQPAKITPPPALMTRVSPIKALFYRILQHLLLGLLAHPAYQVMKARPAHQDRQDLQAQLVLMAYKDRQDLQAQLVLMAYKDRQDLQALQVRQVKQEQLEPMEHKDLRGQQAQKGRQELHEHFK
jgi:hypothetical protein